MRAVLCLVLILPLTASAAEPAKFFETEVRPLLSVKCFACHTQTKMGGLEMVSRAALLKGRNSGPAVEPLRDRDGEIGTERSVTGTEYSKRGNDDQTIAPDRCLKCGVDGRRHPFSPDHVPRIRGMACLRHVETGPFRGSRAKPCCEP